MMFFEYTYLMFLKPCLSNSHFQQSFFGLYSKIARTFPQIIYIKHEDYLMPASRVLSMPFSILWIFLISQYSYPIPTEWTWFFSNKLDMTFTKLNTRRAIWWYTIIVCFSLVQGIYHWWFKINSKFIVGF